MYIKDYNPPHLNDIIEDACAVFGVSIASIIGPCRKREFSYIRQLICYVAFFHTNHSLKYIGQLLGNRDHTTAMSARDIVSGYLDVKDEAFMSKYWLKYTENSKYYKSLKVIKYVRKNEKQDAH